MILNSKAFHSNNLTLQLIYHNDFDIYTINIHRHNNNSDIDLFGIFTTYNDALLKFNSISL